MELESVRWTREEFLGWLAEYFVSTGSYTITRKAFEDASLEARVETPVGIKKASPESLSSNKQFVAKVKQKIAEMIRGGRAKELIEAGAVHYKANWESHTVRKEVLSKFVETIGKPNTGIRRKDFSNSGLEGLIVCYYRGSMYPALVDAGGAHSIEALLEHSRLGEFNGGRIYPWEMQKAPMSLYKNQGIRIAATNWLLWKTKKNPRELTRKDYVEHGLAHLVQKYYRSSPYEALVEAGYAHRREDIFSHATSGDFSNERIYPWEMTGHLQIYEDTRIRTAATRWLIWKTKKNPRQLCEGDFDENGFEGMLTLRYKGSVYRALAEAGYAHQINDILVHSETGVFNDGKLYPWEMERAPHLYGDLKIRVASVRWLSWKEKKPVTELTSKYFIANGLSGVLEACNNRGHSYKKLLADAEYRNGVVG